MKEMPTDQGKSPASSPRAIENALQFLAATASNDKLRERYLDDKPSTNSYTSPLSHDAGMIPNRDEDAIPADEKLSDANSEDDDSGSGCSGSSSSAVISKTTGLRKGKWTVEEEEFATRFIHYFSSGLLCLPEGKTLRASLAEKLQCDPMRITKKYGGASCLGNKISKLCNRPRFLAQDIEMARLEIARLERRFHLRMAQGGDVPLPPDNESDASVVGTHAFASTASNLSSTNTTIASSSGGVQHAMNASFSQLGTASVLSSGMRLDATSVMDKSSQPTSFSTQQATTTPSISSHLSTLARNAKLAAAAAAAAASISPNAASMMVGVPPQIQQQTQLALAPLDHQNLNNTLHNTHTMSQVTPAVAPAVTPAVNWPTVFQGISQAGINNATTGLPDSNKQLVQTLLLQITSQLQALAALSPSAITQIQLQILAATTAATPTMAQNPPPQQAPITWASTATGNPDSASIFSGFQFAAAQQVQSSLGGAPSSVGLQYNDLSSVQATGPAQKNFLVGTNSFTVYSNQTPHSNLVTVQNQHQQQANQGLFPSKIVSDTPSIVQREAASSLTTGNNMEEFLNKLRQKHAEAVEQARREQASDRGRVLKKQKKSYNAGNSGIVTLLEHATTESSGSGCTTNEGSTSSVENAPASDEIRNDGSTSSKSSSEEDDAESGGQASSTSSHRKQSIPLRKRFRPENRGGGGGGITRRNLADHNYRMAEEMKNQDK